MTNDLDNATIEMFRSSGRLLARGIAVKVPAVPSSTRLRVELGREAERDRYVRKAWGVALAQAEKARQVKPQVLRRNCGTFEIR
jgi:hypothetical protein